MLHTNSGTQSMKKEIRKTFGFAGEKFSAKVRLHTKMPGVFCLSLYSLGVVQVQMPTVWGGSGSAICQRVMDTLLLPMTVIYFINRRYSSDRTLS